MVSKRKKRKSWIPGQIRAEKVLADAIAIDGRKEWICKLCSETKVWTRWRCSVGENQGLVIRIVILEWWRRKDPETRLRKLKGCERMLNSSGGSGEWRKWQGVQGESKRRESGLEEDWKMQVDAEVDKKKKLEQRKRLQKQHREIEKCPDMDQKFREGRKRNGRKTCKRLSRGGTSFCNIKRCRKGV